MTPTSGAEHERFADWDAAYLMGALSPAERKDYESHLDACPRCREALAELVPLPGLLARVPRTTAEALLDDPRDATGVAEGPVPVGADRAGPPADLVDRITRSDRRRRLRRRTVVLASIAAAALAAVAIVVPLRLAADDPAATTVALERVVDIPLDATVGLEPVAWGTRLEMECRYASSPDADPDRSWSFALWVTDESGATQQVSTWSARAGQVITMEAGTSIARDRIALVEIRSLTTGETLLAVDPRGATGPSTTG